jgi:hypothetical protein
MISHRRFEQPSVIARKAGARRVNAQLGRLHRAGLVERVPGARSFLYRSRQGALE